LLLFSCAAALVVAWLLGRLSPMVVLGALLGANANQVHKWSHRTPAENGPAVGLAQRLLLIQSPGHHHQHHSGRRNSHYCVLTNLLNPVLDRFRVWRGLEWVLRQGGLGKRDDDQLLVVVLAGDPGFLDRPRS
jgi:ubiquitin-conjugating enzyme E2 variant